MWFLFGFLTLLLCICVEFWRRHLSRWTSENSVSGLQYKHVRYNDKVTTVLLGVTCSNHVSFSLKRQSWMDEFFKTLGVSNEFETGDSSFDDLIYLVSDNKTLHYALANSVEFRTSIKKIMNYGVPSQLEAREIYCRNGRLWVRFKAGSDYSEGKISFVAKALEGEFKILTHSVQEVASISGSRWNDPFVVKAAFLLAISSGLAINGGLQLFRLQFGKFPFTIDYSLIVRDSLIYGIIAVVAFVVIAIYWLGRSARAHLVLIELMTIGAFGVFSSIATEMRDINIEMDASSSQVFETPVERKYTTRGRRSGTKYHVIVKDWRCDCGSYELLVPDYVYASVSLQSTVQILQRQGYLHYQWVSDVKAL